MSFRPSQLRTAQRFVDTHSAAEEPIGDLSLLPRMMRLPADFWRELIAHKGYAATREPDAENYVTMSDDEVAMLLDFDGRRFWHQWRTKMRHPTAMPGI